MKLPLWFRCIVVMLTISVSTNLGVVLGPENALPIAENRDERGLFNSFVGNLMSKSYGNGSQMISVNLTNLLVLILLKALIFAAGTIGVGALKDGYYHRRNVEEQNLLTDEEILLFMSFLAGSPGNNGCLQYLACKEPKFASRYKEAGEVLLKTAKMLDFDANSSYQYTLDEVQEAIDWGVSNQDCKRFSCDAHSKRDV